MKDPGSAQFEDVSRFKIAVCGRVNAKNIYGGYVGFRRFIVAENDIVLVERSGEYAVLNNLLNNLWGTLCRQDVAERGEGAALRPMPVPIPVERPARPQPASVPPPAEPFVPEPNRNILAH